MIKYLTRHYYIGMKSPECKKTNGGEKMKTNETLNDKLKTAENKMPGIKDLLKGSNGNCWGTNWSNHPEDIEYQKIGEYDVLAAKWFGKEYSDDGGGVAWNEWTSVHYRKQEDNAEIKTITSDKIVTRDQFDPRKDRTYLWQFDYIGIETKENGGVEAYWANAEGKKGPAYNIKLD